RLFERFHRIQGARARTHEGTGIGLSLVRELAHLHGGTVEVESTVDRGSTFTVSVPFGTEHLPKARLEAPSAMASAALGAVPFAEEALRWIPATAARASAPPHTGAPGPESGHAGRVLVVDDNADMREYVARILGDRWFVDAVGDGVAALAAVRATLP